MRPLVFRPSVFLPLRLFFTFQYLTGPRRGHTRVFLRAVARPLFAPLPANGQRVTLTCYLPDCCRSLDATLERDVPESKGRVFFPSSAHPEKRHDVGGGGGGGLLNCGACLALP